MNNKVTYRQQFTRCGKQRCRKCKEGAGHGPYWYAYWSENGRTISKYIGIHPPVGVELTPLEPLPAQSQPPTAESGQPAYRNGATQATSSAKAIEGTTSPIDAGQASPVLRIYLLGQLRIERRN